MSRKHFPQGSSGYTLVEMVVVMAIFTVVMMGIYTAYDSGTRYSAKQQDVIALQQQGRLALTSLERDLRMMGYGYADVGNLRINAYPPGASSTQSWAVAESWDNQTSASVAPSTDSIALRYSLASADVSPDVYLTQDHPNSAADTFVYTVEGFQQGDLFLIYDPRNLSLPASLLQVSNDPTQGSSPKDKLIHNSGANGPYNPPNATNLFPSGAYTVGSRIINFSQSRRVKYHIDPNRNLVRESWDGVPDPTQPPSSAHTVAVGIEDLQIRYGFKNALGSIDWSDGITAGDPSHDVDHLRAVRVSMIVRSARPVKGATQTGTLQLDSVRGYGNGIPRGGGNYLRILITTVIELRNLGTRG